MKKITFIKLFLTVFAFLILTNSIFAADPPGLINYQGILRDSSDKPLNGSYDMIFTFFSASIAGDEILVDQHLAAGTGAVTVTDGLFTAWLGGGQIFDGPGPGTYTTMPKVFGDYTNVYLEIEIYNPDTTLWELLNPRIRIIAAAYALNADNLDGKNSLYFLDTSSTTQTKSGKAIFNASSGNYGVEGYGPTAGGYFKDNAQSGYAYLGFGDTGISAHGNWTGGYFQDLDHSGYAYVGYVDYGIYAFGSAMGGYFGDTDSSGYAYVGYGNYGISAHGTSRGGYFSDTDSSGYAYVGVGDNGIWANGTSAGGYFSDTDSSGYAYVGYGNYGIEAHGSALGGYFIDTDSSGQAYVGWGNYGIAGFGNSSGGYFEDTDSSGYAFVGSWDYGIEAYGYNTGGYFSDINSSGYANVGYGDRGIWGRGTFAGATFSHPNGTTYWADVSTSTRKIYGTGTVSFVQNHPYDKSKVITYAAPEGDEVAVYTRGTARLINGDAVVKLGESFSWVANPDIGLTAHITPRDPDADIYVESLSTSELLVRANKGSSLDATFDYIVFGLRIGFEELAVVQDKSEREAFLPSSEAIQEPYAQNPELKAFNALERFKRMRQDIGENTEVDLTRSQALAAAIDENKQAILAKANEQMETERKQSVRRPDEDQEPLPEAPEGIQQSHPAQPERVDRSERTVSGTIPMDEEGNIHAKSFRSSFADLTRNLPVSEPVETGDVLVVDPLNPQAMKQADMASDPAVVGIVAGEPGVILGQEQSEAQLEQNTVAVALSGIVLCRVDASYGAIRIGDLLTTSAAKGHAMKSPDYAPGTIIGKALEPLDAGTGLIKVLVMMR